MASIHQRMWLGFLYIGMAVTSRTYNRFSPQKWLIIGTVLSTIGYSSLLLVQYVPMAYFAACQVACGVIAGFGGGIAMANIIITPQAWLDKTRDKLNPYLFLGAPLFSAIAAPLGQFLIYKYTWSGAVLIFIGVVVQQFIFAMIMMNHSSVELKPEKKSRKPHGRGLLTRKYSCVGWIKFQTAIFLVELK